MQQNNMVASRFAQIFAEERNNSFFNCIGNNTLSVSMGEAKIFKDYLEGEIDHFKELKLVKLDEMLGLRRPSLFVNIFVSL